MTSWKLTVPTYYGSTDDRRGKKEFDSSRVPVLIHEAAGLRILLGSHDAEDCHKPDVQVERRPGGWAVFLNPDGGDPCAVVFMLDDGRKYCVKVNYVSNPLEMLEEEPIEVNERSVLNSRPRITGEST